MPFSDFHEVRFPLDVSRGARGGPVRLTDIITLASGREHRNARWLHSRRKFDAGYGIKSFGALASVVAFFEERRGRLIGFRWRDQLDWRSGPADLAPLPFDQAIGTGNGVQTAFQLAKTYGGAHAPYRRPITKPVAGTVRIAVGTSELPIAAFVVDDATGIVTLVAPPGNGVPVTAGFAFDVPVRFDVDELDVELSAFEAGQIPRIPLIEIVA